MDKEVQKQLIASGSAALGEFARVAKTTGEHLYSILVKQQVVEGISGLIAWPIATLLMYFITKRFFTYARKRQEKDIYSDMILLTPVVALVSFIASALIMWGIADSIGHILNPEFYAIKFIFDSVNRPK